MSVVTPGDPVAVDRPDRRVVVRQSSPLWPDQVFFFFKTGWLTPLLSSRACSWAFHHGILNKLAFRCSVTGFGTLRHFVLRAGNSLGRALEVFGKSKRLRS